MKKSEVVKILKRARDYEPDPVVISRIKAKVMHNQQPNQVLTYVWQLAGAAAILLVIVMQNPINQANWSLRYANASLGLSSDLIAQEKVMDATHARLARLNLAGERGKYKREQCEVAYQEFYDYLSKYQHKLETTKEESQETAIRIAQIKAKITEYESEADKKWPKK